jgi:hypothetical protein
LDPKTLSTDNARPTDYGLVPYISFDLKTGKKPFQTETQPWRTNEAICFDKVKNGPNRDQVLQMSSIGVLFDEYDVALPVTGRSFIPYR